MNSLTVVGVGNRLYCDDGIGCELAAKLSANNKDKCIDYIIGETDSTWCLAQFTTPRIIILDAVQSGKRPGSVACFRFEDIIPNRLGISMHNGHLLSILQANMIEEGRLIGIEPFELAPFYGLSEPMRQNLKKIIVSVQEIISDYCNSK